MAIGRIDDEKDLRLYLEEDEIQTIPEESVSGPLVHHSFPMIQGSFSISVEEDIDRGVSAEAAGRNFQEVGQWKVKIDPSIYNTLKERSVEGLRYDHYGSKIHLMHYENGGLSLENLEFYRENKENIREELEPDEDESIWHI